MKTDSAVALKQMNTHTVTVRTRTAAQKLAFLRELIYQDPQIQPIYIPGLSQRADAQTKCLSGPALRKAQEYLNLRHVVTPVVSTIRVLGVDRSVADSSAHERMKGSEAKKGICDMSNSQVTSVSPLSVIAGASLVRFMFRKKVRNSLIRWCVTLSGRHLLCFVVSA